VDFGEQAAGEFLQSRKARQDFRPHVQSGQPRSDPENLQGATTLTDSSTEIGRSIYIIVYYIGLVVKSKSGPLFLEGARQLLRCVL
jgi:hypothetical protein